MAILVQTDTPHGQSLQLYWRLNNFDEFPNREPDGTKLPAVARFRGFLSEKAFKIGACFIAEQLVSFVPSHSDDVRAEAYAALKSLNGFRGGADA